VLCPAAQATVTCTEVMAVGDNTGRILATNVFEQQGGQWKVRCAVLTACVWRRCTASEARLAAYKRSSLVNWRIRGSSSVTSVVGASSEVS